MDNQSKLIVLIFAVIVALGLAIPAFVMSMNCKSKFEEFGDSLTYKQYMKQNSGQCPGMVMTDPGKMPSGQEWYLIELGQNQPQCPQVIAPFLLPDPSPSWCRKYIIPGSINKNPNISESQYNAAMKVPPPCLNLGKTSCDKKDSCQWVPSPIVGAPGGYCYNPPSYLIPQDYTNLDKGWKWWIPPS